MFKSKLLSVISLFILSFGFFVQNIHAAGILDSITITSPATKLVYTVGESLDISGLEVTGNFVQGLNTYTDLVIFTENDITGFDSSAPVVGQVLTITIEGKTTTYTIDIVPVVYTLNYSADVNGTLTGSTTQSVEQNNDGTFVEAIANSGFIFVNWSDGSTANPRIDTNVQGDITVTANFEAVEITSSNNGGGSGSRRTTNTNETVNIPVTGGQVLGASTFAFNTDLSEGMTNDDVKELQERLRAEGFFTFHTSTGFFGPITLAAVKAYQTANGIPATGFVGPLTRVALNK